MVAKNKNEQKMIKYFITNAFNLRESSFLAWLKKKGSAANLKGCIKMVISIDILLQEPYTPNSCMPISAGNNFFKIMRSKVSLIMPAKPTTNKGNAYLSICSHKVLSNE